jgi:hypothetical protein
MRARARSSAWRACVTSQSTLNARADGRAGSKQELRVVLPRVMPLVGPAAERSPSAAAAAARFLQTTCGQQLEEVLAQALQRQHPSGRQGPV